MNENEYENESGDDEQSQQTMAASYANKQYIHQKTGAKAYIISYICLCKFCFATYYNVEFILIFVIILFGIIMLILFLLLLLFCFFI
jgi:hypothetical protein